MKYFSFYAEIKRLVHCAATHIHRFLSASDDWVESVPYETLQMWIGIGMVVILVFIVFSSWIIMKMENTPNEEEEKKNRKRKYEKEKSL